MADRHAKPHEVIVKIAESVGKTGRVFWAIRDSEMGYWRSRSPISAWDAWTRDTDRRAEFASLFDARAELRHIQFWREREADRCR